MSKEIQRSYIVEVNGKFQVLYSTKLEYFITTNGAFGQRDTYIEKITDEEAWALMDDLYAANKKLKKAHNPNL